MVSNFSIKKLYLYVVTLISLILIIIGGVRLIDLGLKTWVFKEADMIYQRPMVQKPETEVSESPEYEEEWEKYEKKQKKSRRQESAAQSIAFIFIGLPLYLYHWKLVQRSK